MNKTRIDWNGVRLFVKANAGYDEEVRELPLW